MTQVLIYSLLSFYSKGINRKLVFFPILKSHQQATILMYKARSVLKQFSALVSIFPDPKKFISTVLDQHGDLPYIFKHESEGIKNKLWPWYRISPAFLEDHSWLRLHIHRNLDTKELLLCLLHCYVPSDGYSVLLSSDLLIFIKLGLKTKYLSIVNIRIKIIFKLYTKHKRLQEQKGFFCKFLRLKIPCAMLEIMKCLVYTRCAKSFSWRT